MSDSLVLIKLQAIVYSKGTFDHANNAPSLLTFREQQGEKLMLINKLYSFVSQALSWFCFIFFSLVIGVITVAFLGAMAQGGLNSKEEASIDLFPPPGAETGTSAFSMTGGVG